MLQTRAQRAGSGPQPRAGPATWPGGRGGYSPEGHGTGPSEQDKRFSFLVQQEHSPVMMPFFSSGSCQLTLSDVSRISVKLRCPTAPGSTN